MVGNNDILLGDCISRGEEMTYVEVEFWSIAFGMRRERKDVEIVYSICFWCRIAFAESGNGIGDAGLLVKIWTKASVAARITA